MALLLALAHLYTGPGTILLLGDPPWTTLGTPSRTLYAEPACGTVYGNAGTGVEWPMAQNGAIHRGRLVTPP